MVRVPTYDAPRVQTQVATEARASSVSPGAFRSTEADQVEAVGGGLSDIAGALGEMKRRVSVAAAEEAVLKFEKAKNNVFFDPEKGYFNTQGRDAFDTAGEAIRTLEDLRKEYAKNLPTEEAKKAYSEVVARKLITANRDIQRHASDGIRAWEVATTKAQVENSIENAAIYWSDPEQLAVNREVGRQAVIDAADLEGITGDALNERLQTYESSFAMQAISAAATTSSDEAQKLLDKYDKRLEGPDKLKAQKAIASMKAAEKEQRDSQLAVLKGTRFVEEFGEETNARTMILEEVNAIEDPDLRKKTRSEAMRQLELKQKADSEAKAAVFEEGEQFLLNGGTVEQFISNRPREWQSLTADQKRKLMEGPVVETDYTLLNDLLTLPKNQLAKVNPANHFSDLAKADRTRLINAVNSARNGSMESVGRSIITQTNAAVEQIIGETKNSWSDKERKKANAIYNLINDEVAFQESQKGSKLTSQEYTDVLNGMMRTVAQKRSLFSIDALFPDREIAVTDIPAEDVAVLSEHLHRNGISATAENIIKAYMQASE